MGALTHTQITGITGNLDDDQIARVIATGATLEEVSEAHGWFVDSYTMGKTRHHRPGGKVAEVCEILESGWVPQEKE